MRVVVIDNYDSFVYNLVQLLGSLGAEPVVVRNDATDVAGIRALVPDRLVISPGPGTPAETGVTFALLDALAGRVPILGVCLGHQAIAAHAGARVGRARRPVHGKTSLVTHHGRGIFTGVRVPVRVARYHSLVVDPATLPLSMLSVAHSDEGELMALATADGMMHGVQFHPESYLTEDGERMLENFLAVEAR